MRKAWIAFGFGLLMIGGLWTLPLSADICNAPGKTCLFVDSSGCVVTCPGFCWATSGGCTFGFGYDAICRCHDNKCNSTCQKTISHATGQFGQQVNQILTDCELATAESGGLGGQCYFQGSVQAEIANARDAAMANITGSCTELDARECFGVTLDDIAGRLLKNAESSAAGNTMNIWKEMGTEVEREPTEPGQNEPALSPLFID